MTIANAFLRPHYGLWIYLKKKDPNAALSTNILDSYLRDVIKSFFVFWMVIGPVTYDAYFRPKEIELKKD